MNHKCRILHVTFDMGIGGTEQVIRQLVSNMRPEHFENHIVCIQGTIGEIGQQLLSQGTIIHVLKREPGLDTKLIRNIRKLVRTYQIDVVHCHQYTPWFYGLLGSGGMGVKVVFTEHGRFHPDHYRYKAAFVNPLLAMFTADIVAISLATRNALSKYEFIPLRKIGLVYNGIEPVRVLPFETDAAREELGIPADAFVVGTVARLNPVKNQKMMLRAFRKFQRECGSAWLLMVGDGPDRSALEEYAQELGVRANVCFTGFRTDAARYLSLMDVFLLSSHTEGTSMTLLESMSLGIPAVATRVGGNQEIIEDEVTGFLTAPDDEHEFAAKVISLYRDPERSQSMGDAAFERFNDRFHVEAMLQKYIALYDKTAPKTNG